MDDTPDPPPPLSIAEGHIFGDRQLCIPPNIHLVYTDEEDVARGYMFTPAEFQKKLVQESPELKRLRNVKVRFNLY